MNEIGSFPRMNKIMKLLSFMAKKPNSSIKKICIKCGTSESSFFRLKHTVTAMGVIIRSSDSKKESAFWIDDYGALNKEYLIAMKIPCKKGGK